MPIFAPKSFNLRIILMLLFHRNSEWGTHSEGIQLISFKSWRLNVNTLRLSRFKGVADSFLLKCAEYVTVQSCSVPSLSTQKCSFCVSRWKSWLQVSFIESGKCIETMWWWAGTESNAAPFTSKCFCLCARCAIFLGVASPNCLNCVKTVRCYSITGRLSQPRPMCNKGPCIWPDWWLNLPFDSPHIAKTATFQLQLILEQ